MAEPTNAELLAQIQALGMELHSLRDEVERLKGASPAAPAPTALPPAPAEAPAPAEPVKPGPKKKPLLGIAPKPSPYVNPYAKRDAAAEPVPKKRDEPWLMPSPPAKPAWTLDEKFIGEKLLQYAGMVILTLGIVFFLVWTAAHAGPEVRVFLAAAAGVAILFAGHKAEKHPPYDQLAGTLIGGGWTVLYVTAYAAGHWEPAKVIFSPPSAFAVLVATAAGMVAHAASRRSRALRLYAVSLTYFVMLFCGHDVTFDMFLILFAASAAISVAIGEADVLAASLAGYYLNYIPTYFATVGLPPAERTVANFISPFAWLAGSYLIVAALPLIPKARKLFEGEQAKIGEGVLCLNSALFGLTAGSMGRVYFGEPKLQRAAMLAALFAVPSLIYTRLLGKRSESAGLNAVLALGLLAAAVFAMPDPMWKLLAWIMISAAWVWTGMFFDQPVWRAAGLVMAMMTFIFYWNVAALGAESRREASMALFLFTAIAYFFSRFHRLHLDDPQPWEKGSKKLWLHGGSLALVLGLWGVLDAAPFLCALCALAVAAEYAAQELEHPDLWAQACWVQGGLGLYSFFVDYGANASMAGVSPRLLTTAVVLITYGYLYFADIVSDAVAEGYAGVKKKEFRAAVTWLAAIVAGFAIYREFDNRLRLPVWAFWSLGLYWVGRARKETHFKHQSVVLASAAAVETYLTYMSAPSALMSPLDDYKTIFFWSSCAALLGGLFLTKETRWGEPSPLDKQASTVFGLLPLLMGAAFFAKEMDSVKLTMAWTGLGLVFLVGGLALDWAELRRPALGLLGVCVGKALLNDTSNMPLPYRVASFVGLGLVLLFGSSLYVRAGSKE